MSDRKVVRAGKAIRLEDAPASLAACIEGLNEAVMLVTTGGRPLAALVPLSVEDSYESKLMKDPVFLSILARSRAQIAAGRFVHGEQGLQLPQAPKRRLQAVPKPNRT